MVKSITYVECSGNLEPFGARWGIDFCCLPTTSKDRRLSHPSGGDTVPYQGIYHRNHQWIPQWYRRFVRGVLETADTTYWKLALAGSTREVVVILDTNTIQLEKRVHRRTPGPFNSRCEVIRIQGYIIELMNPLKSASTPSLVVGVLITSTPESSTAMGGLPSDGFTGTDDDNSNVLTFFKGGRMRLTSGRLP